MHFFYGYAYKFESISTSTNDNQMTLVATTIMLPIWSNPVKKTNLSLNLEVTCLHGFTYSCTLASQLDQQQYQLLMGSAQKFPCRDIDTPWSTATAIAATTSTATPVLFLTSHYTFFLMHNFTNTFMICTINYTSLKLTGNRRIPTSHYIFKLSRMVLYFIQFLPLKFQEILILKLSVSGNVNNWPVKQMCVPDP